MVALIKSFYHFLVAICALVWFRFPGKRLTVIGVTGTDGKTTTTTLIYEILKKSGHKVSMITSVHAVIAGKQYDTGFHVTTPNAWYVQKYLREALNHGDTHVVLEVTSHALEQYRVFGIRFAVAVITNVTHEHLDFHKTFESYQKVKIRLFKSADCRVVNKDEKALYDAVRSFIGDKELVTYAISSSADVTPKTMPLQTCLPGKFNHYNCLAAAAVAKSLGVSKKIIHEAIAGFSGIPGRMEVVYDNKYMVIVDFAHTPNALTQALSTVHKMTKGKLIHVFGSAGLRDASKRPLMGKVSASYADIIVLTEEDCRTEQVETIMDQIQQGIPSDTKVYRFSNRRDAIRFAVNTAEQGDVIICTGKGHEQSLCRGKTEYPWSDRQEILNAVKEIKSR